MIRFWILDFALRAFGRFWISLCVPLADFGHFVWVD
jgi:hypothetical protein